jgi:hypothetical protein
MGEFKNFLKIVGIFFEVPISYIMRVKTLRMEMAQCESKCIKSSK